MFTRGRRSEALLLMKVQDMDPELRDALVMRLDNPQAPLADAHALVERHLDDPVIRENSTSIGPTHLYLWLGDFDGAGQSDDHVSTAISAWDRYPPAWRNSPGMKKKLALQGAFDYWRVNGFPPQCHPLGAQDFNCD